MQQSSATTSLHLSFWGLRKIVACSHSSSQCLLVSTVFGTVSSLHPTSFLMIFILVNRCSVQVHKHIEQYLAYAVIPQGVPFLCQPYNFPLSISVDWFQPCKGSVCSRRRKNKTDCSKYAFYSDLYLCLSSTNEGLGGEVC